jgi:hypothetical protein
MTEEIFRYQLSEAGHAAIHRKHVPTREDIAILLDIMDWLIASIYVHPHKAKKMATIRAR